MGLSIDQMQKLASIAKAQIFDKGSDFFAWAEPPIIKDGHITHRSAMNSHTRIIAPHEALDIYKKKLDAVYSERLAISICVAMAAVNVGKDVALLQFHDEPHLPFDSEGWLVLSIDGFPMFHISPADLPVDQVRDAGLVTVVTDGSAEQVRYSWKGTTKVDELCLLIDLFSQTNDAAGER